MIPRLLAMIRLGRATLVDDSGDVQRLQLDEGPIAPAGRRVIDRVAHIGVFGFTSVPPLGAEVLVGALGGDRTQTIAFGTVHRPSRLKGLQPGDAALYDVRGAKVQLTAAGLLIDCAGLPAVIQNCPTVTITATEKVLLDAPDVECTGNLKVDKLLTGDGAPVELGALRDAYNAHRHTGVATGSGTTGTPDHTV